MDRNCGHQGYVCEYWWAGDGAVSGGAGRDGEARDRGAAHPCEGARTELAGRLRPLSDALDGDGTDALSARTFQVHHRRRREGLFRLGKSHGRGDGCEVRTQAQLRERRPHRRPRARRAAGRAVRFRLAKCTCGEAVRFPDERSEELSRSESRKRVRDFCRDCGRRDFCGDPAV